MGSPSRTGRGLTRRGFLRAGLGGAAAAGALVAGCAPEAERRGAAGPARPPNLLFILADDLGYGDLGCYGQQKIRTPHLDALAAEGMRFTQAYAGSTVCAPSRCCLMTGLHTGHARVRGNALVPLAPEDVTVAEVLRDAGYATGLVGKWGLGEPGSTGLPTRQGFDCFFGYLNQGHAHNYYPDYLWRSEVRVPLPNEVTKGVATRRVQYSHDLFAQEALEFVERHRAGPFFLYLALTIPHANNEAGWQKGQGAAADALGRPTGDGMEVPSDEPYAAEPWPQVERNFAAMVTRMDRDVGRLLAHLKDLGLDGNTAVFFTSDNGPHREGGHDPNFFDDNGRLRGIKRDLYEGGIRVPAIVRWPGRVRPGSVSDAVWAFWDFLPTAAEIAAAPAPAGLDGVSLVPALEGRPMPQHAPLYWEFHEGGFHQAVRAGDWKGVRHGLAGKVELYDLRADPGETRNLASKRPEAVARIEAILAAARTESREFPVRGPPA